MFTHNSFFLKSDDIEKITNLQILLFHYLICSYPFKSIFLGYMNKVVQEIETIKTGLGKIGKKECKYEN